MAYRFKIFIEKHETIVRGTSALPCKCIFYKLNYHRLSAYKTSHQVSFNIYFPFWNIGNILFAFDDRRTHCNPVIPAGLCPAIVCDGRWFQGLQAILVRLARLASVWCDASLWRFTNMSCISYAFLRSLESSCLRRNLRNFPQGSAVLIYSNCY